MYFLPHEIVTKLNPLTRSRAKKNIKNATWTGRNMLKHRYYTYETMAKVRTFSATFSNHVRIVKNDGWSKECMVQSKA